MSIQTVIAQETATIYGKISNEDGRPLEFVNIGIRELDKPIGTSTDINGNYQLIIPANKNLILSISSVGYEDVNIRIYLPSGAKEQLNKTLVLSITNLPDVEIKDKQLRTSGLYKINPKIASVIPTVSGGIESVIKTLPGVSSSSELTSQYSVRGGNYDENLVYVNDIEIYRPFLVRSGQQEGLSFVNSDLVSSVLFSAGGFDAKYGDKMSSVLDITYKKPTKFAGSASGSLLGGSLHLEDAIDNGKLTYLIGVRQKSNQYLLNTLETKGEYKPSFTDVQSLVTFNNSKKWEFSFLGNFSRNSYTLIPETRETNFGTISEALRLKVYFDGQEVDKFNTYFGAFSSTFRPNDSTNLKWIVSTFRTIESETFDIQGQYWLYQLEVDFGKDDFGQEVFTRGVGTFLNHGRNYLDATVYNFSHKGSIIRTRSFLEWGMKYQHEIVDDKLSEWELIDSAGYTLPKPPDSIGYNNPSVQLDYPLELKEVIKTNNFLESNRITAFIMNSWNLDNNRSHKALTAGIRLHFWDVNKQLVFSPRATYSIEPNWKHDMVFRISSGFYYQPPFYRELRDFEGNLHKDIKAQSSIHFVAGTDLYFKAWNRPFKFVSEVYYKYLMNLIPYEVDNLMIKYYPLEVANGYATGIDFRVNGEFVSGIESWASLSLMKTFEDVENDSHGYIPRPTDQRVILNLFFQDYLPKNPTYKMHLNLVFGSSLPFGAPQTPKYNHTLRMPAYRRVDIGFSKQLISEGHMLTQKNPFHYLKTLWISLEVFNLLQISNTISYIWIKDVNNLQYPVPNYLTPRQLNFKLITEF